MPHKTNRLHFKAVLLLCTAALLVGCFNNSSPTLTKNPADSETDQTMKPTDDKFDEAYLGLRQMAIEMDPDAIAQLKAAPTDVIAMLMETRYESDVVTLRAVADGTASMYFSNGGGMIGLGEHEPVRKANHSLLQLSQQYVSELKVTDTFPFPSEDNVRFYVITLENVYTEEVPENDLGYNRHALSPLFHKAHDLITEMRKIAEKQ